MNVCTYVLMYACMYLCMYVCMYVCMYYVCMYVCMNLCADKGRTGHTSQMLPTDLRADFIASMYAPAEVPPQPHVNWHIFIPLFMVVICISVAWHCFVNPFFVPHTPSLGTNVLNRWLSVQGNFLPITTNEKLERDMAGSLSGVHVYWITCSMGELLHSCRRGKGTHVSTSLSWVNEISVPKIGFIIPFPKENRKTMLWMTMWQTNHVLTYIWNIYEMDFYLMVTIYLIDGGPCMTRKTILKS